MTLLDGIPKENRAKQDCNAINSEALRRQVCGEFTAPEIEPCSYEEDYENNSDISGRESEHFLPKA